MQIIPNLQEYKTRPSRSIVLALGNFDGFHLGHQKLLRYVVRQAKKEHALAAVLTFPQHPHSILHPGRKPMMLMSIEQKLFYLAQAGVDLCFLQSFTQAFSKMSPQDFVEKVLVKKLHIREICMGYDAHFGLGRKGDTSLMEQLAKVNGFLFRKMKAVMIDRKPVSSSRIRELLAKGEIEKAQACLGRPFSMFGKVIHGKGHGLHLGFPTANLEVHSEILLPLGVYVVSARFLSCPPSCFCKKAGGHAFKTAWLPGVANFGKRPTYPKGETPRPILELHLLDFKGQVYGKIIEIALHRFLRPERKFPTEEALKVQIQQDVRAARLYYKQR
ncbi:MAG: riboflavin biosynthesis protein RibF [Candidatus Omnitrophota bacterium]|jgi:riboflavin kinase/FMN adenylyltransferase